MPGPWGAAVLELIERGDVGLLVAAYASDVVFAACLPGGTVEAIGRHEVGAALSAWQLGGGVVTSHHVDTFPDVGEQHGGVEVLVEWRRQRDGQVMRQRHYLRRDERGAIAGHVVFPERAAAEDGLDGDPGPVLRDVWTRAQSRTVSEGGYSGARVERLTLDSGPPVVVKYLSGDSHWHRQATGDSGWREVSLFRDGTLDRLPPSLGHAVIAAEPFGSGWVVVQRDVSDQLPLLPVSRSTFRSFLVALDASHAAMRGIERDYLASTIERLGIWWPSTCRQQIDGSDTQPKVVSRGWDVLDRLVPDDVVSMVRSIVDQPAAWVAPLEGESAVLHGDAHFANLAVGPGAFTLLDWGLATYGARVLEGAWLANFGHHYQFSVHDALADVREQWHLGDDPALDRALLVFASGVIPASLSATIDHPDPAHRNVLSAKVADWVSISRHAMDVLGRPQA